MVWGQGDRRYLSDNEAAVITKMNVLSIRNALQRPHVLAYYKQQREVLRSRESAANIHRLCEIRDAANNMPAVQAIRELEGGSGGNAQTAQGLAINPGVVIHVINTTAVIPHDRQIEAKPLIEHESGPDISRQCVPVRKE